MTNIWLSDHLNCEWERVSPCVYCKVCRVRLYQGTIPKNQEGKQEIADALDGAIKAIMARKAQAEEGIIHDDVG